MLVTKLNQTIMEKELFSKEWGSNTAKAAEVIVMLDIINTIYEKSREI